jgi:hypothetical protein
VFDVFLAFVVVLAIIFGPRLLPRERDGRAIIPGVAVAGVRVILGLWAL